jgi:hypothetical protein
MMSSDVTHKTMTSTEEKICIIIRQMGESIEGGAVRATLLTQGESST